MRWLISLPGGNAEGPFEEQDIIVRLRGDQYSGAVVCPEATTDWQPPSKHPPFAAALIKSVAGAAAVPEKSLALAIGLNLVLPGAGYMYMRRVLVGLLTLLLVVGMLATTGFIFIVPTWIGLNAIMAIDMVILFSKHKRERAAMTTMKCPQCAEVIQREARVCRFCSARLA